MVEQTEELLQYVREYQDVVINRTEFELVYHGSVPEGYDPEKLAVLSSKTADHLERRHSRKVTWSWYRFDPAISSIVALSFPRIPTLRLDWPLGDWLVIWSDLQPYLASETTTSVQERPTVLALDKVVQAVASEKDELLGLSLIEDLWEWRWMRDSRAAGVLRFLVNERKWSTDPIAYAKDAFQKLTDSLDDLRAHSRNMDDWLEGLYRLTPLIEEARAANEQASDGEAERRVRMISEIFADTFSLIGVIMAQENSDAVLDELLPKPYPPTDLRQYKRRLMYESETRVSLPRYLIDEVCSYLERKKGPKFPPDAAAFDRRHLVANNFVSRWGM
jgi:hypothetical protein